MTKPDPQSVLNKIFSSEHFEHLNQEEVISTFNPTRLIEHICAITQPSSGAKPVSGNTITEIPAGGLTITSPGTYTLNPAADKKNTLTWTPGSSDFAAIYIDSDDVVLDLNGCSLSAEVSDSSQDLVGIYVKGSKATIKNGTLLNMCHHGIQASNANHLTLENLLISGMMYNNLNARGLCPTGIKVSCSENVAISNCTVQYVYATADACAGIELEGVIGGQVDHCKVHHLTNYAGSAQGISYAFCEGIQTTNSHVDNLQSHFGGNIRATGHSVLGFMPIFSVDVSYSNCSSTNLTGCNDDCHGMSAFICLGVTVEYFKAQHIRDGICPENTGAKATGLEMYAAIVSISNCAVDNIKAINPQDKQSAGFGFWGACIVVSNCIASNVMACDEHGNQSPEIGYGMGFAWAPDPRPVLQGKGMGAKVVEYNNCEAINCQVGFDTWCHIDSTWANVSYTNCDINILVQPDGKRILSANPASECNPPLTSVVENTAKGNLYPLAI